MKTKLKSIEFETMYDDGMLELIEDQETSELMTALFIYSKGLEKEIVKLRAQVNSLAANDNSAPFPDLHSDIYEVFDGYAAYEKFKAIFE